MKGGQTYFGFKITDRIWMYRPAGCLTLLLLLAPAIAIGLLVLLATGVSGPLQGLARGAAWIGGISLASAMILLLAGIVAVRWGRPR